MVIICTTYFKALTFSKSVFFPGSLHLFCIWSCILAAIISLNSGNQLIYKIVKCDVFFAVRAVFLNIKTNFGFKEFITLKLFPKNHTGILRYIMFFAYLCSSIHTIFITVIIFILHVSALRITWVTCLILSTHRHTPPVPHRWAQVNLKDLRWPRPTTNN
jgi:hypothetical protein